MAQTEPAAASLDPRAWLESHGDYLYRYAVRRARTVSAAEDLVQETLLAAWQGRDGFAGAASERSWLTAILKRKIVDAIRRQARDVAATGAPADADADRFDPFDRSGHWKRTPKDWGAGGPAEHLNREEFWAVLHTCLGKLPPRLHEAFLLRYLDERPGEDVCADLGITPANLWTMLHRARLRLCWCLSENWFGHTDRGTHRC
jgi:RNA polymerase sigma-70 factor (ECF subfamily)